MSEFFLRLKERKLVQWAVAYVAAAFALLQGIDIVAQRFAWPDLIERGLIIVACVGFFLALVLAWYHGERGAQRVTGTELLILALLLSLGGFVLWRFAEASVAPAGRKDSIPEKSIAVLPFENLSDDKSNAYFAEGIQDEILTRLAKIGDLKVISRTSTQHFKSSPEDLPQIAQQLGVRNILEGSVQREPNEVRVNVQLINAMTDAHLWAEIYDRKMTDIFSVESDIAKTIADNLHAKLTGSEERAVASRPTENAEAYQLYLQGRFFWNKRTAPDLRKAIAYFNQAIAKDPSYALAYAATAQSLMLLPAYNGGAPRDYFPQAQIAAKKALSLDDKCADAHTALASLKSLYEFDNVGAIPEYARALQLDPNDATTHHWLANDALANLGESGRELAEMKRAQELDPLSLIINANVGVAYLHNGQPDEALAQFRKMIELDGSFYYGVWNLGMALEVKGEMTEAIAAFQKATALSDDPVPLGMLGQLYGITGRREEAKKILARLLQARGQHYTAAYSVALVYLGMGDKKEAVAWLEKGYEEHDGFDLGPIRIDPLLASLHGHPAFEALAEKIVPAREFGKAAAASK